MKESLSYQISFFFERNYYILNLLFIFGDKSHFCQSEDDMICQSEDDMTDSDFSEHAHGEQLK